MTGTQLSGLFIIATHSWMQFPVGAELIAWKGSSSTNASPWENQALVNFDNYALPVLSEFGPE